MRKRWLPLVAFVPCGSACDDGGATEVAKADGGDARAPEVDAGSDANAPHVDAGHDAARDAERDAEYDGDAAVYNDAGERVCGRPGDVLRPQFDMTLHGCVVYRGEITLSDLIERTHIDDYGFESLRVVEGDVAFFRSNKLTDVSARDALSFTARAAW